MSPDLLLAQQLTARLCHDLGGAVGTLAGLLDMVDGTDADLLPLARETATALRDRLRLYGAAWGSGTEALYPAACTTLLMAAPAAARVTFALDGLGAAPLPATVVRIVLTAALLGADALPRAGTVSIGRDRGGLTLLPEGQGAAWPSEVLRLAAGATAATLLDAGPRRVLAPLLAAQLARAGWNASLPIGPASASSIPPLLLGPS